MSQSEHKPIWERNIIVAKEGDIILLFPGLYQFTLPEHHKEEFEAGDSPMFELG